MNAADASTGARAATRTFAAASPGDLAAVLALVDQACAGADGETAFAVRLAAEEVFTNILAHGYGGQGGWVAVAIGRAAGELRLVLCDEAAVFDPACAPAPPAPGTPLDEREPGGLGWHLVHQLMDEVLHVPRQPRGNTYTLVKRLPATTPAD